MDDVASRVRLEVVEQETRRAESRATDIIRTHFEAVREVAISLLERRRLTAVEVRQIVREQWPASKAA